MKKEHRTNGFSYTYSAEEQAEIKRIRDKYTPPTESTDAMERLRRLDAGVTQTAQTVSLIFGIVGALLLGFGMSLIMTDLGSSLGNISYVFGILLGLIGGTLASLAYPVYNAILTAKRKKIAPEIIRLTDELMK
ncbi:MAG: hypothetical protein IJW71_06185 [Clostridia bacterium]|nr:hypothetical protein [Clostridia bacterium]